MKETPKSPGSNLNAGEDLRLVGILAHALPVSLGTADAPERYTVPAVFDRAPLPREVALIEGSSAAAELADAGYPAVTLKVVDRRLEIGQTSIGELKSGLAGLIASILHDASVLVRDQNDARLADLTAFAEREARRSAMVLREAAEVSFTRASPAAPDSAETETTSGQTA